MALLAQLPGTMSPALLYVGDTHRFEVCGDDVGLVAPMLDDVVWVGVTGALLTLTPPGQKALKIPLTGILAVGNTWYYEYLFTATLPNSVGQSITTVGTWDAYWTLTNGTISETLGSYQFKLLNKRGS